VKIERDPYLIIEDKGSGGAKNVVQPGLLRTSKKGTDEHAQQMFSNVPRLGISLTPTGT
jgi:hypothetical protein